jgi:asparagine synthase (glutamine-hydrolysing)
MVESLKHRGPDDDGWEVMTGAQGERIYLGSTRLSVIDTSPHGHQPMISEDGELALVYNGEIYNFPDIKSMLVRKGYGFRSGTDTEVLLHAYREWGAGALDLLKGMFAFAVWDGRNGKLFLARDRLGKKPLYYTAKGGTFAFASEIKALLAVGLIERKIDPAGLADFLTFQFTVAPRTIFSDVRKVEPGTTLTVKDGTIRGSIYWSLKNIEPPRNPLPIEHYEEGLEIRLREAVKRRLISDVPLGVFLSGGLDSSLIVGLMAEMTGERVKTFSMGFLSEREEAFNELQHARKVARHFDTDHHEHIGSPEDIEGEVEKIAYHFDEPFGGGLHTYFVSCLARKHVTVALSGLGGDELFAGYEWNRMAKVIGLYRRTPRPLRRYLVEPTLAHLRSSNLSGGYLQKLKKLFLYANIDSREWYPLWISVFHPENVRDLVSRGYANSLEGYDPCAGFRAHWNGVASSDPQDRLLYLQIRTTMLDDFLNYTDRMSMAHSLECRVPYLDHELVEFSMGIPFAYKMRWLAGKHILRRFARKILPRDIVERKKQPFLLPLDVWMRGRLKPLVLDLLLGSRGASDDILDREKVKTLAGDFFDRGMPFARQVWSLFTLKLWEEVFLTRREAETRAARLSRLYGKTHEKHLR